MLPPDITAAIAAADYVVGVDEVGYGAWAGPLVVCAVVLSKDWPMAHLVKDSKAFTGDKARTRREAVVRQILPTVTYFTVTSTSAEIDASGSIYKLLPVSHGRAIDGVIAKYESMGVIGTNAVIVDGTLKVTYGGGKQALSLPKADALIAAVSAASLIGKVARDAHMNKMAVEYPQYGFDKSAGYGTPAHAAALEAHGPCPIHRRSFSPIARLVRQQEPSIFDLMADVAQDDP